MIVKDATLIIDGKDLAFQLSINKNASGFLEEFSTSEYPVSLIDANPFPDLTIHHNPEDKRPIFIVYKRST